MWDLFNTVVRRGESVRALPRPRGLVTASLAISNWTELDVWRYIDAEALEVPSIYYAHERPVFERDGMLFAVSDVTPANGSRVFTERVRYRTVGDLTVTGAVRSDAVDIETILTETAASRQTERGATRADDRRPMVATVRLTDELDVGRGDLLVAPGAEPEVARELEATVCWMLEAPARVGARYLLKHTTRRVRANIAAIDARLDISSFEQSPAEELGLNDIGRITAAPVLADPYASNRATGAFILIDTVAAGDGRVGADRQRADNLRHGLSGDLGFDPASRSENMRRVAHVARLFADAGAVAVVSLGSPFREDRLNARRLHEAAGLPFVEVFVDTPIEECARRDPKGLYARARAGRLTGMTGENAPYEPPEAAEFVIRDEPAEVSARRLVEAIA